MLKDRTLRKPLILNIYTEAKSCHAMCKKIIVHLVTLWDKMSSNSPAYVVMEKMSSISYSEHNHVDYKQSSQDNRPRVFSLVKAKLLLYLYLTCLPVSSELVAQEMKQDLR